MDALKIKEYNIYKENEILPLYVASGWVWYASNPELLRKSYENSLFTIVAVVDEKIVGVLRLVGDGVSIIYFQDIIVLPDYQRLGIGRKLVEKAMDKYEGVYQKVLSTDDTPKTVAFYKSLGFIKGSDIGSMSFFQIKHN